jgi:hypothetical protein
MRNIIIFLGMCLFLMGYAMAVEPSRCSSAKMQAAEEVSPTLKNWDEVFGAFKKYATCDDGAIGEGFSDSIGRLLASHWNTLDRLATLSKKDKTFSAFVIKHIDETLMPNVLLQIHENAITHCPQAYKLLCKKIEAASKHSE